jgi:hypothetical protein
MASKLHEDKWYIIVGKPNMKYGKVTFSHPDVMETEAPEDISEEEQGTSKKDHISNSNSHVSEMYNSGRIFPIYPELM